jgi:DNA-binding XRE family transcriptional regulator
MNRTQWEAHYFTDLGSDHVNPLERFGEIVRDLQSTPFKQLPPQEDIHAEVEGLINAYQTVTNRKPIPKHLELLGNYCLSHYLKSQNSSKKNEDNPILSHHQNERTYKQEVSQFNDELRIPTKTAYFQRNPEVFKLLESADNGSPLVFTGATLKQIRESCEISQKQVAEGVGISEKYLSSIERGVKPLTAKMNLKIVDFLTSNQAISLQVLQFALSKLTQEQGAITA